VGGWAYIRRATTEDVMILKKYLEFSGESYEHFAEQLGVGKGAVYKWTSSRGAPSMARAQAIHKYTHGQVSLMDWPPASTSDTPPDN
jgi:DNA-binding transcriptional regulator YdaS (Cro superfamily)